MPSTMLFRNLINSMPKVYYQNYNKDIKSALRYIIQSNWKTKTRRKNKKIKEKEKLYYKTKLKSSMRKYKVPHKNVIVAITVGQRKGVEFPRR